MDSLALALPQVFHALLFASAPHPLQYFLQRSHRTCINPHIIWPNALTLLSPQNFSTPRKSSRASTYRLPCPPLSQNQTLPTKQTWTPTPLPHPPLCRAVRAAPKQSISTVASVVRATTAKLPRSMSSMLSYRTHPVDRSDDHTLHAFSAAASEVLAICTLVEK